MPDYGIKILKPSAAEGVDVLNAEKKDLIIISTAECHKVAANGTISTTNSNYTHSLSKIPFFEAYWEDTDGSLYPFGYFDDSTFDSLYASLTTSVISLSKYGKTKYFTLYFE